MELGGIAAMTDAPQDIRLMIRAAVLELGGAVAELQGRFDTPDVDSIDELPPSYFAYT